MDGAPPPSEHDSTQDDPTLRQIGDASLRLMAGVVSKARMEQLQKTVERSADGFPWQQVTAEILAEDVPAERIVQQGLVAQRDWILRGGRTSRGPTVARRAKGLLARLMAQMIFGVLFTAVVVTGLIVLQHKFAWADIYQIVPWFLGLIGRG